MALSITSKAFSHEGEIPQKHTGEGDDVSPHLSWSGVPEGTKSLVLIVDDPDAPDPAAPKMTWVHWVVYDLPPDCREIVEGAAVDDLPPGTKVGLNDWERADYGGPMPPIGRHRYFHKLYALDTTLSGLANPTKADVEAAMTGHILEDACVMGTYEKTT